MKKRKSQYAQEENRYQIVEFLKKNKGTQKEASELFGISLKTVIDDIRYVGYKIINGKTNENAEDKDYVDNYDITKYKNDDGWYFDFKTPNVEIKIDSFKTNFTITDEDEKLIFYTGTNKWGYNIGYGGGSFNLKTKIYFDLINVITDYERLYSRFETKTRLK